MSETLNITEEDNQGSMSEAYVLRLYVTGASINSLRAVHNLTDVCDKYLNGNYSLEIIDVYQEKSLAQKENIIALPLLIKSFPLPERRMVGDMSNTPRLLKGLGLAN